MTMLSLTVIIAIFNTCLVPLTLTSAFNTIGASTISRRRQCVPWKPCGRSSVIIGESAKSPPEQAKMAPMVTGEELELMLTEWEQPLIVDAYATWCGPCILMAPEFEEAAKELDGRVRFVKLDTDKEPEMAARLNIMGLPTLLFLDKYEETEGGGDSGAQALLKERVEGALRKDSIVALCEHHFFGSPRPVVL